MKQISRLTKAEVLKLFASEGDTPRDLLAWTRNQPKSRVAATYNMKGGVWEAMGGILQKSLDKLPPVINKDTISYLKHSTDAKDLMVYCIILWMLYNHNQWGLDKPENKGIVLSKFRFIQARSNTLRR